MSITDRIVLMKKGVVQQIAPAHEMYMNPCNEFVASFLGNPMMYTFGRFVDQKYKPAYYDSTVSFCHPITGLFPHANGGELFVYLGIAAGITALGLPLGDLAVRYFLVGIVVILMRGIVTEKIYFYMRRKEGKPV